MRAHLPVFAAVFVCFMLISGCAGKRGGEGVKDFEITTSGYSGFAGFSNSLTVKSDGSYYYEYIDASGGKRERLNKTGALPQNGIEELRALLEETDVFSLKDSYSCVIGCGYDAPSAGIGFKIDGRSKSISISSRDMPQGLSKIFAKMRELRDFAREDKPIEQEKGFEITYAIGSGWTGYHEGITVRSDGGYLYELVPGKPSGDEPYNKTGTISEKDLAELRALMNKTDVFGFDDEYWCKENCPYDLPSASINFAVDGRDKFSQKFVC